MPRLSRIIPLLAALTGSLTPAGAQVVIDNARGVDSRVDYTELDRFGPWDDRNYLLTAEQLALLSPKEAEATEAIPAFYRVQLRKDEPGLARSGEAQYPRSALPRFLVLYGGYLVDGKLYRSVTLSEGRFEVLLERPLEDLGSGASRALSGEVRVTSPNGGAESAVAIHPTDTDLVVAGSNGPGSGQRMHYSSDGGETWTQAPALPGGGGTCCDPTVEWSSDGTYVYAATLRGFGGSGGVWFYRSSDDGQTWTDLETETPGDPRRELGSTSSDKEYLHVDRYATSPHKDHLYLTWHQPVGVTPNVMHFARSTDSGNTWNTQAFSTAANMLGIGSDIVTDKSGNVYYVWASHTAQKIWVKKSTDGGASFAAAVEIDSTLGSFIFPLPSTETRQAFIYAAAAADLTGGLYGDSLYVAWTDNTGADSPTPANNHGRIQVAYSRDGGATWTTVTPHETADANSVDRWHPWIGVGPDGRVHVAFYDTRFDANRTTVDFYHSVSSDGGVSYSTPERLTTVVSPNIANSFEFGDYNGLDIVMNNLITVFTDNRAEGAGAGDSVDIYGVGQLAEADLAISKVDGVANVDPGGSTVYTITASNNGPDDLVGAVVQDTFPAELSCTWTCSVSGSATCTAGPVAGDINDTIDIPFGSMAIYMANCNVDLFATGSISNTATISGGPYDPATGNNSATDVNAVNPPPPCTLPDDDLVFDNDSVDDEQSHEACNSITAGPAYVVEATGDLTFAVRDVIVLRDGFSVELGGLFTAVNDPFLNP